MNQTRSHESWHQKVNSYRRIFMAGARYTVLSNPLKLQFWQHYTLIMPRNNNQQKVSSHTQAFCMLCGERWSIRKVIHPVLNSRAFFFPSIMQEGWDDKNLAKQHHPFDVLLQGLVRSLVKSVDVFLFNATNFESNPQACSTSLGTDFAVIITNAVSDGNFYCSHTYTALWIQLLHVPSFNSPKVHVFISGLAWTWAEAFHFFTLELMSVTFPLSQLFYCYCFWHNHRRDFGEGTNASCSN